jgi:hypothetical protein
MTGLMTQEQSDAVIARFDALFNALTPEQQRGVLTDEVGQLAGACAAAGIDEGLVHDIVNQYYAGRGRGPGAGVQPWPDDEAPRQSSTT